MDRRIFGLESEYGITCAYHGVRRLTPDEVARYLFRRVVSWGRSSNVFLTNGARLYLDVGSHPEYATPECDSLIDLVAHDKAGERMLERLLLAAQAKLADEGVAGDVFVFKNNTDSAGNSYGCHENYLVSRQTDLARIHGTLIPFLVSRQCFAGAGKILHTPRGAIWSLSQRAEHLSDSVSSATTRSRPIINTRDEPHADAERYRRLHVIAGDSNMSEYATLLKVGTTAVLLRLLEDGVVFRDLTLDNPIRALRDIARDATLRRRVVLSNGRELTALQIQREYLERAWRFAHGHELGDELTQVLKTWDQTLIGLEDDPLSLDREVDWVIKYRLVEAYRARHQLPLDHARVALLDLAYHDVNRARGLYYLLERRNETERVVDEDRIERASHEPPSTTRARLRAAFLRESQRKRRDVTVDWVHLKLNDQPQRTVVLKDPFKAQDERVDRLIADM